jgi:transcriptional regulator with XRE-family HTH domain
MDTRAKIRKWIEERRFSQTAAAKAMGVPQPTLSQFLSGQRQHLTAEGYWRVAISLNTTVDALLDDKIGWPLPPRGQASPNQLTESQRQLLSAGELASRYDAAPENLETAIRRVLGLPEGPLQPATDPPPRKR